MRLLHTSSLTLHEFFNESVPSYGILSHTWVEGKEVSYQDMLSISPSIKARSGYEKIINCAYKIKELGYNYVWIDTCCIDKSSSAELSESINSMFQWYKGSKVCLACMADVEIDAIPDEGAVKKVNYVVKYLERYPSFQMSRWFTRGWTLQELIAPKNVIFYDSEWQVIAKCRDIAKAVEQFTGIPAPVLEYGITNSYCVAEKMKWASERSTTRREDMAYCLLGLFDINMPLLYGEGDKAFERLQEEILKRSDDLSLFLWQDLEDSEYVHRGLLARSPAEFSKFSLSWGSVDVAWTLPEHFNQKTWITPKHPCWITNIGLQLSTMLLPARDFWNTADNRDGWDPFFNVKVQPQDDEYVFNVISFVVGSNLICFYILLKRLENNGNQFARLLPGRIAEMGHVGGSRNQPPETIFIRQNPKIQSTIMDPRIYGFSISVMLSEESTLIPSLHEASELGGQSCSSGLMGKRDGNIFRPAVVSRAGVIGGFLITLSQLVSSKTFCVLVNYQQPLEGISVVQLDLKYFQREAAPELCTTYSFSDMSNKLEGMRVVNLGGSGIESTFTGYSLDRGRVLVGISISILE